jgi:hypothetical protein
MASSCAIDGIDQGRTGREWEEGAREEGLRVSNLNRCCKNISRFEERETEYFIHQSLRLA